MKPKLPLEKVKPQFAKAGLHVSSRVGVPPMLFAEVETGLTPEGEGEVVS